MFLHDNANVLIGFSVKNNLDQTRDKTCKNLFRIVANKY